MIQNKNLYHPNHLKENSIREIEDKIELLLIRADYFVQAGDFEHALECYDRALEAKPTCIDAWIGVGVVYIKENKRTDAEKVFQKVLLMKPDSKRGAIGLALANYENGNLNDALEMLRKADTMKQ